MFINTKLLIPQFNKPYILINICKNRPDHSHIIRFITKLHNFNPNKKPWKNWFSQTCIERTPFGNRKRWSFKTGDLLQEAQFI